MNAIDDLKVGDIVQVKQLDSPTAMLTISMYETNLYSFGGRAGKVVAVIAGEMANPSTPGRISPTTIYVVEFSDGKQAGFLRHLIFRLDNISPE